MSKVCYVPNAGIITELTIPYCLTHLKTPFCTSRQLTGKPSVHTPVTSIILLVGAVEKNIKLTGPIPTDAAAGLGMLDAKEKGLVGTA